MNGAATFSHGDLGLAQAGPMRMFFALPSFLGNLLLLLGMLLGLLSQGNGG